MNWYGQNLQFDETLFQLKRMFSAFIEFINLLKSTAILYSRFKISFNKLIICLFRYLFDYASAGLFREEKI